MNYSYTTEASGENTLLTVTWFDGDGVEIVKGEKLIKGLDCPCESEAAFFAADLRRNFAEKFPPEPMPEGEFMMGGIE